MIWGFFHVGKPPYKGICEFIKKNIKVCDGSYILYLSQRLDLWIYHDTLNELDGVRRPANKLNKYIHHIFLYIHIYIFCKYIHIYIYYIYIPIHTYHIYMYIHKHKYHHEVSKNIDIMLCQIFALQNARKPRDFTPSFVAPMAKSRSGKPERCGRSILGINYGKLTYKLVCKYYNYGWLGVISIVIGIYKPTFTSLGGHHLVWKEKHDFKWVNQL